MRRTLALVLCVLLLLPAVHAGQEPPATYAALLEKVKQKDPDVDFAALRLAFTETDDYQPYGGDRDTRKAMSAALNEKNFAKVVEYAEKILQKNFLDINAHMSAFRAHTELQNQEKAAFHRYVGLGLLNSILQSGDGKTPQTAYVVISTDEEYVLMNFLGIRPSGQSLMHKDQHSYDVMTGTQQDGGETVTLYFNIDKPFGNLAGKIDKAPKKKN
jgi:uncharacterized protein DUF4919